MWVNKDQPKARRITQDQQQRTRDQRTYAVQQTPLTFELNTSAVPDEKDWSGIKRLSWSSNRAFLIP